MRPVQPKKFREPIDLMESGTVREPVKPEQPENEKEPIDVTELGIVREPIKL